MDPYPERTQGHPAIPIAIIVGFAMVAITIFLTGKDDPAPLSVPPPADSEQTVPNTTVRPLDTTDYVKGNPNAPIVIIEYSDYDCPFCKQYHDTLTSIMNEYGVTGKVAWVYRQFPLAQLHPNAPRISEAALCVGSLGGSTAFWSFTDNIFLNRAPDEQTNMVALEGYAIEAGVDAQKYRECLLKGDTTDEVEKSVAEALALGARGTPYTVITVGSEQAVVNGAQPYEVVKGIIDTLVSQLEGTYTSTTTTTSIE
jgi:protein-disulfide isomerase